MVVVPYLVIIAKKIGVKLWKRSVRMKNYQEILKNRIDDLCRERNYTYYNLSYKASVPLSTLMHIMNGECKNPGLNTIIKICDGLEISLKDFFDTEEFVQILKEVEE